MAPRLRGSSDRVQRHDQRLGVRGQRGGEQIVGVGVLVRRQLQRDALVHRPAGQPVQLDPGDLEQRGAAVGGQLEDVAQPVVPFRPLGNVRGLTGMPASIASSTALRPATHSGPDPGRPVAAGRAAGADRGAGLLARCAAWYGRSSALGVGPFGPPARGGPGRRNPRCCPCPCAGPRPCAGCCRALRPPFRTRDQRGPAEVSETSTPRRASASRMASAVAKSLRARAACRWSSSSLTSPSTTVVSAGRTRGTRPGCRRSAQALQHAGDLAPAGRAIRSRSPASRAELPSRTAVLQHGHRGRGAQVVVHRGDEGLRDGRSASARPARWPGSTKLSIRASAVADSAIESSEYSMIER